MKTLGRPRGEAAAATMPLEAGATLAVAGCWGPLWRLQRGALRLDRGRQDGGGVAMLALPGDVVGLEVLSGAPYAASVRALVPSVVTRVPALDDAARQALLLDGVLRLQRRAAELLALRAGTVAGRLRALQALLESAALPGEAAPRLRLKDAAALVASTPETTCRVLAELRAESPAAQPPRRAAAASIASRSS